MEALNTQTSLSKWAQGGVLGMSTKVLERVHVWEGEGGWHGEREAGGVLDMSPLSERRGTPTITCLLSR